MYSNALKKEKRTRQKVNTLKLINYKDLWAASFPPCTVGPNNVGSCCIRLHTTPNIVGATMLGDVTSVCTQLYTKDKIGSLKKNLTGRGQICRLIGYAAFCHAIQRIDATHYREKTVSK